MEASPVEGVAKFNVAQIASRIIRITRSVIVVTFILQSILFGQGFRTGDHRCSLWSSKGVAG
jgi:hypothetical protein